jgi:predicted transcriptional regulator
MIPANLKALCDRAQAQAEQELLNELAALVRCGLGTLQSADRTADTARRRAAFAWALSEHCGWTVERIARVLHRKERQIAYILAGQPKKARKRGRKHELLQG